VQELTPFGAVADALARTLVKVTGLAARSTQLFEGVDRAMSPDKGDSVFAFVDGSRDEDDAVESLWFIVSL
jgi:hypothetical protein